MTSPGYVPRHGIIDAAMRRIGTENAVTPPAQPFAQARREPLTPEQRAAAAELFSQPGGMCRHCGGAHAAPERGCPRLASFELDNDGNVRAGTYFPPGTWEDPERIIFAHDAQEPPDVTAG